MECHLGSDVLERAHPEMRRPHPGLDRAKWVLNG